ncbi:Cyclic di-GMP phosphodiesterase [Methylococcales bacterium]|nr:Cyclic di-GMP phosphodiesterase [Methylococcales bacterium]
MPIEKPHTFDYVEKVKLRPCDLRPGMFICELDRPWLESPFLLQGFEVQDEADIEAVAKHCDYVYIDLVRTRVVNVTITPPTASQLPNQGKSLNKEDIAAAQNTRKQTSKLMKTFMDEIRFGQSPELEMVKAPVSECVVSIMRNPDVMMFMTRMRSKDGYVSQHAFNVCIYSIIIGRLLGLDATQLHNLGTCGLLHDIGMLVVPDHILNKPGDLTEEETAIIQSHTTAGRDILMTGRNIFDGAVDVAYGHHENLDGSGYPRGLEGNQLNANCKIVSIVDKYEAITNPRPFRIAGDHLSAVAVLNDLAAENKIDSALTYNFIAYLGVYPQGTIVELSSKEVGIVIGNNLTQRLRPQVLVVLDEKHEPTQKFVDLAEKAADIKGRPYRIAKVHRPGDFGIDLNQYSDLIVETLN